MKKALIVANTLGFISLFLRNDVESLKERDYKIDVAGTNKDVLDDTETFFHRYGSTAHHVDFTNKTIEPKALFLSFGEITKLLRQEHYDVIHCHTPIVAAIVRQAAKKYRKKGTKIIYTSHGFPFYEGAEGKKVKIFRAIERHYSKYTDAIITICDEDYRSANSMMCNHVYKMNGVGINLIRFDPLRLDNGVFDREEYRHKLGFKTDDTIILSVGELNTNKNHQVIIRALAEIKENRLIYAICGRELTESGKKTELLSLANDLGVDLRFLGFRKDIPEVCACADIGAIPSFKEGLGLSGVEMLASGIPVVGSRRQGIKDYVIDGETGYLADPNVPSSFAEAIRKTLDLKEKETTSVRCREVAAQYSVEKSRNVIDRVYSEVL